MVLVKTDAVKAELIHQFPGVQMFRIRARSDLRTKMPPGKRPGQLLPFLQVIQMFPVR